MNATVILTKREAEIAELLAWGAAKKEVADTLYISTRTVENTARNIFVKCGIQKATELCVWWFCTQCGVSFEMSPIKRAVSIVILFFFIQSNIIEAKESKRYFESSIRRIEETECRRLCRDEDINELDYLLN